MIKPRQKQAHLQLLTFLKFDFGVHELRFAQRHRTTPKLQKSLLSHSTKKSQC